VHVVLAHPHATFYPYTCGLRRDAAAVTAELIDYDDIRVAAEMTTREEAFVIDYFLCTDARLCWIIAPTLLPLLLLPL
jgi:hypothetical protein